MKTLRKLGLLLLVALVGCTTEPPPPPPPKPEPPKPPSEPTCVRTSESNPLIGQWYFVLQQRGVAGEVQTLMTLMPDGKLKQQTRVKQGRNIRSELRESGCWAFDAADLKTQIVRSNGELVDFDDPIYTSHYSVDSLKGDRLILREKRPDSKAMTAKRMPPSFILK